MKEEFAYKITDRSTGEILLTDRGFLALEDARIAARLEIALRGLKNCSVELKKLSKEEQNNGMF